ncbi:MAG: DUF4838 domain-containing protein [Bacteroidetes bacterium]|nr:DUF4838 domain-containing protein [Bacteroidota bacterium]
MALDRLLGKKIVVNEGAYNMVKDATEDLRAHLSEACGVNFTIEKQDSSITTGIFLNLLYPRKDSAYLKRLDIDNQDVFLLEGDGKRFVKISAFSKQGLVNGIYTYLDRLGFRWYYPGELWKYVPKLMDVGISIDTIEKPDFVLRAFFGTFGTPRNRVIDKNAIVDREWNLWSVRNRLGGTYSLKGHAWGDFFWRNIQTFLKHPEYAALVNGKRSELNSGGIKFCTSNKGLQELFVQDRVAELKKNMNDIPNRPVYTVSVEPSDGEGFCECDECRKLGTISTRVFLLANLVAKEFQKVSPKAFVNLYAYNKHAAPPDIALEPNVIVQIIPYGYQDYTSPEVMFKEWKLKCNHLFVYDYYGLPILNLDKPLQGSLTPIEFANRIRFWHDQGIKGITLESSYSIGATGLGLYLFSRLSWNINTNVEREVSEFYQKIYGNAAGKVRQAQSALETDTNLIDKRISLHLASRIIDSQETATQNDTILGARLTSYKAYLLYLNFLYDFQRNEITEDTTAIDRLMTFVYGTFFLKMVHPFPVSEWLKNYGANPEYAKRCWDTFNPTKKGMKFSSVRQWRKEEIDAAFRESVTRTD